MHLYKIIYIYLQMHANHRTKTNNWKQWRTLRVYKKYAIGVPCTSLVLTKRQYVTSWEWERVAYLCLQQYSATEVRWLSRRCTASSLGSEASQTLRTIEKWISPFANFSHLASPKYLWCWKLLSSKGKWLFFKGNVSQVSVLQPFQVQGLAV